MNFLLLLLLYLSTYAAAPLDTCDSPEILGPSDKEDRVFKIEELDAVYDQPNVTGFVLKIATCCSTSHGTKRGDETSAPGIQHTMAFGVTKGLEELTTGLAALPCPPHCPEKGDTSSGETMTIKDYLTTKLLDSHLIRIKGGLILKTDE